jgi:hypothetical protein
MVKKAVKKLRQTKVVGTRYDRAADAKRTAKKPGKRMSKSGKVYTERRVNRSDKSRKTKL